MGKMMALVCALFLAFLPSCNKSLKNNLYSNETLAQDVTNIFKNEYQMTNVTVEVADTTLVVYLTIKDIFKMMKTDATQEEAEDNDNEASPDNDHEQVITANTVAARAALNNGHMQFYKIVVMDGVSSHEGFEYTFTRSVIDIKKSMFEMISQNDSLDRYEITFGANPSVMGRSMVSHLFKNLANVDASQVIKDYFPVSVNLSQVSPTFFAMLMEHNLKINKTYDIVEMHSKRLSTNKALIYVKVNETYDKDSAQSEHIYVTPSPHMNEYLFTINTALYPRVIESIDMLYSLDDQQQLQYTGFPKAYEAYKDLTSWDTSSRGPIAESFPLFVIKQITEKIKSTFTRDEKLQKFFLLKSVSGQYKIQEISSAEPSSKIIQFTIDIDRNSSPEALNLVDNYYITILNHCLTIIVDMLRSYEFTDYTELHVQYEPLQKHLVLDNNLVKRFYRNQITIPEILQKPLSQLQK